MHPEQAGFIKFIAILIMPFVGWIVAAEKFIGLRGPKISAMIELAPQTLQHPPLIMGVVLGCVISGIIIALSSIDTRKGFKGAKFDRHLRGTEMTTPNELKRKTKERDKKKKQVTVAEIPIPLEIETLHFLLNGATGTGKSVSMRELSFSAMLRGDRMVILDPNGDMLSKFGREKDIILNPYDSRSKGWSIFNEIRNDFDFERFALSLVPRGASDDGEEWREYGRLIVECVSRKLNEAGDRSIKSLFHWCTIAEMEELRDFLEGTKAQSLFAGSSEASKALTSARFVLSSSLSKHVDMPGGDFSIRDWLDDEKGGNIYITWREDMAEALKPIISTWVDIYFSSVLSLPESKTRRLWAFIDELASLSKLPSLEAALTKVRKHGLRVVAGLQSTAQLDRIYGREEAQTIRACFRSLVVLGGSKDDPQTNEDMSKSIGEHEVERDRFSMNMGGDRPNTSSQSKERNRERVIMPSEIATLPNLEAIIALAGNLPITRTTLKPKQFKKRLEPFIEKPVQIDTEFLSNA